MSTRSLIGKQNADKTVTFIYCHFDGYPSGVGDTLIESYSTPEQVDSLLALGDLSVLGGELGEQQDFNKRNRDWCLAYGRDRGETGTEAQTIDQEMYVRENLRGEEYKYIYSLSKNWVCYGNDDEEAEEEFTIKHPTTESSTT
jgi:hypothetical protein